MLWVHLQFLKLCKKVRLIINRQLRVNDTLLTFLLLSVWLLLTTADRSWVGTNWEELNFRAKMAEESVPEARPRRTNAGRNIGKLINQELDDFYKTAYGGFEEASEDEEYEVCYN